MSDSLGLAHSEADVIGYFRAAGFADVGVHEFIAGSLSRISGSKAKQDLRMKRKESICPSF